MWRISRRAKNHFNISAHSRAISSIWRAPANRCGWMGCGLAVWAVARMMSSFLFGVRPTDPLTFTAVAALLLGVGVALLASYLPARRAAGIDPLIALKYE